jgi:deoxyribodipyrimidine photolyase-like uncharacterized protein
VWACHDLAKEVGTQLGRGQILFRPLPRGGEAQRMKPPVRHLVLVLGDQLWPGNPVFDGFDPTLDRVLMIEAPGEATGVWSHKARIALFLSAMRHFCNDLHRQGWPTTYVRLDEHQLLSFQERLTQALRGLEPEMIMVCEPGEWRMLAAVQDAAREADVPLAGAAGPPFHVHSGGIRALGRQQEGAAHGVLLPRHAPPPWRADERRA